MELWIRSQDKKELVQTNDIYLARVNNYFHIYCHANSIEIDLGEYGDFEDRTRALEVLDDIENFITVQESLNGDYELVDLKIKSLIALNINKIYIMPER